MGIYCPRDRSETLLQGGMIMSDSNIESAAKSAIAAARKHSEALRDIAKCALKAAEEVDNVVRALETALRHLKDGHSEKFQAFLNNAEDHDTEYLALDREIFWKDTLLLCKKAYVEAINKLRNC
jgi:hypothetical protein